MGEQDAMRPSLILEDDHFDWGLRDGMDEASNSRDAARNESSSNTKQLEIREIPLGMFWGLERVAGIDISFIPSPGGIDEIAVAALVVCEFPSLRTLHEETTTLQLDIPYAAGFLGFREVPSCSAVLAQVPTPFSPQIVLVDGSGLLHHRSFGSACHFGLVNDIPTVGVAKNPLAIDGLTLERVRMLARGDKTRNASETGSTEGVGREDMRNRNANQGRCSGGWEWEEGKHEVALVGDSGRQWGAAVRSIGTKKPVYVSQGHRVSLNTSVELVKACMIPQQRVPVPIQEADQVGRRLVARLK